MTGSFIGPALALTLLTAPAATPEIPVPTFTRDVAPILYENCATCHRPGEAAPFSLLSHSDARNRAWQMVLVTESGFMPPWKPEPGYGRFAGARRLSPEQVEILRQWERAGAPEGDPVDLPPPPRFADGWQIGKPDLVVRMPEPYVCPPEGTDIYRNFVVPLPVDRRRYVRAVEFRPGNNRLVHHARMVIDRSRASRRLDAEDDEPGWDQGMSLGQARNPDGHYLGWTPGRVPRLADDGTAWSLDPDTDLVVQVHMQPTGKPEPMQFSVGLFFTDEPPTRSPTFFHLGSKSIDIPGGVEDHVVRDAFTLPVDVEVLGVYPHAHYLARDMKGWAELPDGRREWLLWIKDWDFNWQDQYWYEPALQLPRGTVVHMEYVYDNSENNVRNPFHPPRRVVYGEKATDEMGDLFLQVLTDGPRERELLERQAARKAHDLGIARLEKLIGETPGDPTLHQALARHYGQLGRRDDAYKELRTAAELAPKNAVIRNGLGAAAQALGRLDEAAGHYREATALAPDYAEAHSNLGLVLTRMGRPEEAEAAHRRALEVRPDYAAAHFNLGFLLARHGRPDAARVELRKAGRLAGDSARMQNNVGFALAGLGDHELAVTFFSRALELVPDSADAHANMGRSLFRLGRADEAAGHFRESLRRRPGDAGVLADLGAALADTGRLDEATVALEKALSIDPRLERARRNLTAVRLQQRDEGGSRP